MFAFAFSCLEWLIEYLFMPVYWPFILVGSSMCITGHLLRLGAMFHAASNFHHVVQTTKKKDHRLVTTGVYQFCRHPSYLGWSLWAIGT